MSLPVSAEDVAGARRDIDGIAIETPLLRNRALDEAAGARVWLKAECLQVTGSFKIRGAAHRIARMSEAERKRGVVAFSSGNHAQGVARAARLFGCPAAIVMPSDAPAVKAEGVRADGAELVPYDRETQSREEIAAALATERGAVLIPSFDDPFIVAGQGTLGLETAEQLQARGVEPAHFLCCTGGGGLISGSALGLHSVFPDCEVWSVEPEGHDDWARSLVAGKRLSNAPGTRSICDAILTPMPGEIPFAIARQHLSGGLAVSDEEVREAMRFAFRHLKLVLEPGGAAALAAAVRGLPEGMRGRDVVIVATGGNVDPVAFARILEA